MFFLIQIGCLTYKTLKFQDWDYSEGSIIVDQDKEVETSRHQIIYPKYENKGSTLNVEIAQQDLCEYSVPVKQKLTYLDPIYVADSFTDEDLQLISLATLPLYPLLATAAGSAMRAEGGPFYDTTTPQSTQRRRTYYKGVGLYYLFAGGLFAYTLFPIIPLKNDLHAMKNCSENTVYNGDLVFSINSSSVDITLENHRNLVIENGQFTLTPEDLSQYWMKILNEQSSFLNSDNTYASPTVQINMNIPEGQASESALSLDFSTNPYVHMVQDSNELVYSYKAASPNVTKPSADFIVDNFDSIIAETNLKPKDKENLRKAMQSDDENIRQEIIVYFQETLKTTDTILAKERKYKWFTQYYIDSADIIDGPNYSSSFQIEFDLETMCEPLLSNHESELLNGKGLQLLLMMQQDTSMLESDSSSLVACKEKLKESIAKSCSKNENDAFAIISEHIKSHLTYEPLYTTLYEKCGNESEWMKLAKEMFAQTSDDSISTFNQKVLDWDKVMTSNPSWQKSLSITSKRKKVLERIVRETEYYYDLKSVKELVEGYEAEFGKSWVNSQVSQINAKIRKIEAEEAREEAARQRRSRQNSKNSCSTSKQKSMVRSCVQSKGRGLGGDLCIASACKKCGYSDNYDDCPLYLYK